MFNNQLKPFFGMLSDGDIVRRNSAAIIRRNTIMFKIILSVSILVNLTMILFLLVTQNQVYSIMGYLFLVPCFSVLLLAQRFSKEKNIFLFLYLAHTVFLIYSIITDCFLYPDELCVSGLFILIMCPVTYLDKSARINIILIASLFVYFSFIWHFKPAHIAMDETINALIFTLLSSIIGAYMRFIQLQNYDMVSKLNLSEKQYAIAITHSENIICRYDICDMSINMSDEVATIFNTPKKVFNVPYGPVKAGNISLESVSSYISFYEAMQNGEASGSSTFRSMTKDGWKWFKAKFTTIFNDNGFPVSAIISFTDVTKLRDKELAYEKWKQELSSMSTKHTSVIEWNLTSNEMESESGELITDFISENSTGLDETVAYYINKNVCAEDKKTVSNFLSRDRLLNAYAMRLTFDKIEFRHITKNNALRWLEGTVQLVPYPDTNAIKLYLVIKDIHNEKSERLKTEQRAKEDFLTGLLNRATFNEELSNVLLHNAKNSAGAFLMIDIDNFKSINDTFGHSTGDDFLKSTSDCLKRHLEHNSIIGRLGGDEFAIYIKGIKSDAEIIDICSGIQKDMERDLGSNVKSSASIGIAMCPNCGTDFNSLYRKADTALYAAKKSGKGKFLFYCSEMNCFGKVSNTSPIDC